MNQGLSWIFAFNLIVNSFFAFLTSALFLQLLLLIFRMKQPRCTSLLLCAPVLKLAVDPFLYNFQNWALAYQMDPVHAERGSRILSIFFCYPDTMTGILPVTAIRFSVSSGQTFTPADIIALTMQPIIAYGIVIFSFSVSLIGVGGFVRRLRKSLQVISGIVHRSTRYDGVLRNQVLVQKIQQTGCQLIISSETDTPAAFGLVRKWICFPDQLMHRLTQEEFEAVVAHELDHLRWYDGILRLLCHLTCAIFWWIPTRWWLHRVENAQEDACDATMDKYGIARLDLASAIVKTAKACKATPTSLLSTCFVRQGSAVKRLRSLLDKAPCRKERFFWLRRTLAVVVTALLFSGRFWMF